MIHKFKSIDSPDAAGRQPQSGDQEWTLSVPLEGGDDYLELTFGRTGRDAIRRMVMQEEIDDAEKDVAPDVPPDAVKGEEEVPT